MAISQRQIRDLQIDTVLIASTKGRPNEVMYCKELNEHFYYIIDVAATADGTTVLSALGVNAFWKKVGTASSLKDNTSAVVAPSATDDASLGYAVGSTWVNNALNKAYICVDSTATAAIWNQIDAGAAAATTLAYVKMTQNQLQSILGNVSVPVQFNVAALDNTGIADTLNNQITIARAGIYSATCNVGMSNSINNDSYQAIINVNGQAVASALYSTSVQRNGSVLNISTGSLSLAVGDTVTVTIFHTASTRALSGLASENWLSVTQLAESVMYNPSAAVVSSDGAFTIPLNVEVPSTAAVSTFVLGRTFVNNTTAIIAPTVTDDTVLGYAVGSTWIDTVSGKVYKCVDATAGAAVWEPISGADNPLASTFQTIALTTTVAAGAPHTSTVSLGASAAAFNASKVEVLLNGMSQVKGADVTWITATTFGLTTETYADDVVQVKP